MTPWWILNVVQPWIKQLPEHMREPRVSTVILVDFQTKATWISPKNNGETERKLGKFFLLWWEVIWWWFLFWGVYFWLINRKELMVKRGKTEEYLFDRSWKLVRRFREEVGTWHVGQSTLWTRRFNERGEMNSKKPNPTGTGIPNR